MASDLAAACQFIIASGVLRLVVVDRARSWSIAVGCGRSWSTRAHAARLCGGFVRWVVTWCLAQARPGAGKMRQRRRANHRTAAILVACLLYLGRRCRADAAVSLILHIDVGLAGACRGSGVQKKSSTPAAIDFDLHFNMMKGMMRYVAVVLC
ncbi:unnamed protein product, partial [Iphiclides podalirius]